MKKKGLWVIILAVCLLLAGCGRSDPARENAAPYNSTPVPVSEEPAKPSEPDSGASAESTEPVSEAEAQPTGSTSAETETSGTHTLVIYFSRTGEQYTVGVIDKGNTAIVAEMIAEKTGADLFEVLPIDDHYPMTYSELTDIAKQEQNSKARPEYAGELPDLSQYDTVFIGAPVWWGDWPMILYTVFENNDFSEKKLVPFSTHEGSGLSGFDKKLASACPDAEVLKGLAVRGNDAQNRQDSVREAVQDWLSGLGY